MTKTKSTKRALLMSVLALVLCLSMLIGTTFAWFTDSVTSSNNRIVAGNLDIELEYAKVVDGQMSAWKTVAGATEIFDPNALWEPGRVEVVYLKVSNLGTLDLKYQLGVNVISEIAGINVDGKEFKLSQYLVFKTIEMPDALTTYSDREAVKAASGTEMGLKDYNGNTTKLDAGDTDYVAMIVYMPETVGNEANYRGTDVPTINLGVNLFATQAVAESDSFGSDYDKDAWLDGMKVYDANDLQAAINNGKDVVLMKDIALSEQIIIPEFDGDEIVIDLNGHKLSNANGSVIRNEGDLVITGKGTIESTAAAYAIRVQKGSMIIDSANIEAKGSFGAVSIFNGAAVTINGGSYYAEGINGMTSHCVYVSNSTLTVNGGTFDCGYSSEGIDTICGSNSTIALNNGTFYASELGASFFLKGITEIKGGTYQYKPNASFLATGYNTVANADGSYIVLPAVTGVELEATEFAGIYTGKAKTYYVADKTGLMNLNDLFAKIVPNEGNINTIELLADVDLSGEDWKPLTTMWVIFNGNDHTISNLTASGMDDSGRRSGFWGYAGAVTINDLTLENVTVNGSQAGVFAGAAEALKINNCFLKGDNKVNYVAGVEDWCGIGAISGVVQNSTMNVTIVEDATVTLNKAGFSTAAGCTFVDNLTGYITPNNGTVINKGEIIIGVSTTAELIDAIKNAPVGDETVILMADGIYAGNIDITVAALGKSGGDVVIKAAEGAKPVITGTVTLGYRNQGVGATMYNANVTFEGITFKHAETAKHSIVVQDVKSITLKDCKIIGDGEYGVDSARGNATGTSKIVGCTFENAGMQLLGNLATGLVIDGCTFNESRINIQAGNGVTVQNCEFNNTLTAANVGDSFYAIRSNSTAVTVKNCEINIDSKLTEVATAQAKWYLLANRGTTNWTVEKVSVTLTDAALAQTELKITACTSTGKINTTNVTLNGEAVQ